MSIPMTVARQSMHNAADKAGWRLTMHTIYGDVWERPSERITVDYAIDGRIAMAWISGPPHVRADGRFEDCLDARGKYKDRQVIDWMKRLDWSTVSV